MTIVGQEPRAHSKPNGVKKLALKAVLRFWLCPTTTLINLLYNLLAREEHQTDLHLHHRNYTFIVFEAKIFLWYHINILCGLGHESALAATSKTVCLPAFPAGKLVRQERCIHKGSDGFPIPN